MVFYTMLILSFLGCNQIGSQDSLTDVSPKEFQSVMEDGDVQLIDVRKPEEFIDGHIANAINIDYYSDDFVTLINGLDKKSPVYIYCRSGKRSGSSVSLFKEAGFTEIYNLKGGILSWKSDGLPVKVTD